MSAAVNPPHASDAEFVRRQLLPPGSIAVFDKGCVSFALRAELAHRGVFFVTRMKAHNQGRVVAARRGPSGTGVRADETCRSSARQRGAKTCRRCGA